MLPQFLLPYLTVAQAEPPLAIKGKIGNLRPDRPNPVGDHNFSAAAVTSAQFHNPQPLHLLAPILLLPVRIATPDLTGTGSVSITLVSDPGL